MGDIILNAILYVVALILYYIEVLLAKILDIVYGMFEVFAGIRTVTYNGKPDFLINVFFGNSLITNIFMGMALIGTALTIGFTAVSVIKKTFDSNDKVKFSFGQILTNAFKAILLIFLMSAIVTAAINTSNILMQQIDSVFTNAEFYSEPDHIEFNDEDYATMFRILNTIGNYSLNPTYDNTYNINSCFNAIRGDLQILGKKGFFKFTYKSPVEFKDLPGYTSWQEAIMKIGVAADLDSELNLDEFNSTVSDAVLECMALLKTDGSFKPLSHYEKEDRYKQQSAALGRTIMIASSYYAAENEEYNEQPNLTDEIRGPFYSGDKDIYDRDDVEDYFDIRLDSWNHLIAICGLIWLIKEFLVIVMNLIGRIFNMLLLYLTAPGFIATMPLDDGGKFKQWTTAFVIQCCGVFGTFVAVRLLVCFVPIVLDPTLVIYDDSPIMDVIARILLVIGAGFTASTASQMITGILADNAGFAAITAGNAGAGAISALTTVAKKTAGLGLSVAGGVASGVATATGVGYLKDKASKKLGDIGKSMRENGGIIGAARSGFSTKEGAKEMKEQMMSEKQNAVFDKILGNGEYNNNTMLKGLGSDENSPAGQKFGDGKSESLNQSMNTLNTDKNNQKLGNNKSNSQLKNLGSGGDAEIPPPTRS